MSNFFVRRNTIVTTIGAVLAASVSSVQASGFRIPEISIAGLGTANALVANPEELGALPYNPAAMGFHQGGAVGAGVMLVYPSTTVNTTSGSSDSDPETPFIIPNFFISAPINADWTFGLNVNAPFGLETKYKPGAFPGFGSNSSVQPTQSELKMININPNIGVKVNPNVSIAFGLDYMQINSVKFDSVSSELSGDGSDWGYNLGIMFATGPWSGGLSYRSGASIDIDGSVRSPFLPALNPLFPTPVNVRAETTLDLPAIAQVGVRYAISKDLAVEFDVDRTYWSKFDNLTVKSTSGTTLVNSHNNWSDSNAYRIGATWALSTRTQLRFGYAIDETPQDSKNFSARIPDADRQLFSFGVNQDVGDGWNWEGGVMYVLWDDRKINSSTAYTSPTQDPNGTSAFNGKYESDAWLIGFGVGKKF